MTTAHNPIINKPREAPLRHWARSRRQGIVGADRPETGRLPAHGRLPTVPGIALRNSSAALATQAGTAHLLEMVNDIRAAVGQWQKAGYPRATRVTRDLISHWTEPHPNRGLYFAQQEAILTAVWLTEIAPDDAAGRAIIAELDGVNAAVNDGIPRICHQMATGTGKTAVMAALMLWQTANHRANPADPRFTNRFLAITPGITVRERLESGLQFIKHGVKDESTEYCIPYLNLTPNAYLDDLRHIHFQAVNYHQFLPQDLSGHLFANGQPVGRVKAFAGLQSQLETPAQVIERVLGRDPKSVMVINDEAHHCHRGDPAKTPAATTDTRWFDALRHLHNHQLIHGYVRDLSATPSFIAARNSPLFPWLVSQYNLQEAEDAGIVKIMRLPKSDRLADWTDDKAKNIYASTPTRERKLTREDVDRNSGDLKTALSAMYDDWNELRQSAAWAQQPTPPVVAIVANTVVNADRLYDYIAGWNDGDATHQGQIGAELSNIDANGLPYTNPRTIVVHTKLDTPDSKESGAAQGYLTRQAAVFRELDPESRTTGGTLFRHAPDQDVIRTVLNTVGKAGQPGGRVRCVVSVGMLTEGWDARTVTHIVGFRQFGTQLLCEQVSGRALRRVAHDADDAGYLYPEYADILGIPFANLGRGPEPGDGPAPPPHYTVRRLPDRRSFAIRWPNITGYRRTDAGQLAVRPPADWNAVAPHLVPEYRDALVNTTPQALAGESNELDRQPATRQEFSWLVAKYAVDRLAETELDYAAIRRGPLFYELLAIIKAATDAGKLAGPAAPDRWPNRNTDEPRNAALWLLNAVGLARPQTADHAVIGLETNPRWLTTSRLNEYKSNRRYRHDTAKSQVNIAVCDSDWEVQVAAALDAHPAVSRWIRNERLGWTIPYRWDGMNRQYEPDFIAVVPLANGQELHVVIEVKGQLHASDDEKERWTKQYWLPAVNAHPEFSRNGPWAYIYVAETPLDLMTNLTMGRAIAEANAVYNLHRPV